VNDLSWLGFATVLAFVFFAGTLAPLVVSKPGTRLLLYAGLSLRVLGAVAYFELTRQLYNGGDYILYYERGLDYASQFKDLNFSALTDVSGWAGGHWWGSQFIYFASGFVFSLIGPGMLGGFLIFSLLAFIGLIAFGVAFRRSAPYLPTERYLRWIWLFPSLWFWPSAIGKDAIILCGLGLCAAGYVGRAGRMNWLLLVPGFLLVFSVRPQVAIVTILSLGVAQWLATVKQWSLRTAVQGILVLAVSMAGLWVATRYLGITDVSDVSGYLTETSALADRTGNSVSGVAVGLVGVPLALVNILLRPFPWEIRNTTTLLSCIEILAFWILVFVRRRTVMTALRGWRSDRLRRMAVPFILIYAVTLGMVVVNLGIIARQRIFVFPFLFLFFEARAENKAVKRGSSTEEAFTPLGEALFEPASEARRGRPAPT
jgi:hypothetical protein